MEHLHPWFVAAAYAVFIVILAADALVPRFAFSSLLSGIALRERRQPKQSSPE